MRRVLPILLTLALAALLVVAPRPTTARADATCGLTNPAFCETFDAPVGGAERTGDLNSVVWGASRITSGDDQSQGIVQAWAPATLDLCGTNIAAHAGTDIRICNGQLREAVNDGGNQTILAMYPRQPFDIAGRTGTVAFDMSNDTGGNHTAWPAFVYTDQPVPAPYGQAPGIQDQPRNSLGISFAQLCGAGSPCGAPPSGVDGASCWSVNDIWTTTNYALKALNFADDSCAAVTPADGPLDSVRIALSTSGVKVYASEPGDPASLHLIAHADATTDPAWAMPLTRGLVWMEDVHYNAAKYCTGDPLTPPCERNHTFTWADFGFDGPVLPRDLGVEAPDNTQPINGSTNIGWIMPQSGNTLTQTFAGTKNVAGATAALLEFTTYPQSYPTITDTFSYSFNGHAALTATPHGGDYNSQTIAVPVNLADLQDGTNTLTISDQQESIDASNFDLILVGAGGLPATATPTAAPSATQTASATATSTPAPTATGTAVPTATATATAATHTFSLSCSWDGSTIASIDCKGQ